MTKTLINLDSEVNIMSLAYTAKLGLKVYKINIETQKIDGSIFTFFEIVLADFQVEDKLDKTQFFWKTILVANIILEIIFKMSFFTFNNVDI